MSNSPIHTEVDRSLVDLLLKQSVAASKGSLAAGFGVFAVLAVYEVTTASVFWLLTVIMTSGARIVLLGNQAKCDDLSTAQLHCRTHNLTGLASAFSWGLLAFLPTDFLPLYIQSATWAAPVLVATTAMSSYSILIDHFRNYLIVLTTTVLAGILLTHGSDALGAILAYTIFGPVIYITGHRYHGNLMDAHKAKHKVHDMLVELKAANKHLCEQHALIRQEEEIARHVFHQLTLASDNDIVGIHAWNQAMGNLSGDLIQIAHGPTSQTYIFLGDFTGHGLPAALGAVPASTVFRTMADKGLPVTEIARELNYKLYHLLPTNYFCCAAVVELSHDRRRLTVWNGGLPAIVIYRQESTQIIQVPADNLPLGVVGDREFSDSTSTWTLDAGDGVYIYSDGLTEAKNIDGEMWGNARFLEFLQRSDLQLPRMLSLKEQLMEFTNLAPASDDISIIEIEATPRVVTSNVA